MSTTSDTKAVLSFAVELGDKLLRNGGEVYRVEDSVMAVLHAYDITDCDVYVLSNGIFASANESTEDGCSVIRHVPIRSVHLYRIAAINNICRKVCNKEITLEEARIELEQASTISQYSAKWLIFSTGVGCGGFGYLFGGSIADAIMACLIGFLLGHVLELLKKANTSKAVTNVLTSALVTIFALAAYYLKLPIHYDKVIIGDIMPMVPGIALTTSIRDFINGDYLSGAIKLIDALLTAFCIAVGVGIIITLANIFIGGVI